MLSPWDESSPRGDKDGKVPSTRAGVNQSSVLDISPDKPSRGLARSSSFSAAEGSIGRIGDRSEMEDSNRLQMQSHSASVPESRSKPSHNQPVRGKHGDQASRRPTETADGRGPEAPVFAHRRAGRFASSGSRRDNFNMLSLRPSVTTSSTPTQKHRADVSARPPEACFWMDRVLIGGNALKYQPIVRSLSLLF
jgi:hypothetical protein